MLKHQPWLRLGRDIRIELEQCIGEGRDVEKYRAIVDDICKMDDDTLMANESWIAEVGEKWRTLPSGPTGLTRNRPLCPKFSRKLRRKSLFSVKFPRMTNC